MNNIVDKIVGLFLEAEEFEKEINVIVDGGIAYEVVYALKDDFDCEFCDDETDDINKEFENLLEDNDILSIALTYEDGQPLYYLQEVINNEEDTLEFDSDMFYIQDDLLDIINVIKLNGEIYAVDFVDDETNDLAEEIDNEFDDLIDQVLEDIKELQEENPNFCLGCYLKDNLLPKAYLLGYNQGLKTIKSGIDEILKTK